MKKLLALTLAALMMCLMTLPIMADNTSNGTTELSYTVSPSYTVTFPEAQAFSNTSENGNIKTGSVVLGGNALIHFGKTLKVTVASQNNNVSNGTAGKFFKMKDGTNENYLFYKIEKGTLSKTEITNSDTNSGNVILSVEAAAANTGASETLTFTADSPTIAGEYKDILTFTVSVN